MVDGEERGRGRGRRKGGRGRERGRGIIDFILFYLREGWMDGWIFYIEKRAFIVN